MNIWIKFEINKTQKNQIHHGNIMLSKGGAQAILDGHQYNHMSWQNEIEDNVGQPLVLKSELSFSQIDCSLMLESLINLTNISLAWGGGDGLIPLWRV